jgi:hypothetical protein
VGFQILRTSKAEKKSHLKLDKIVESIPLFLKEGEGPSISKTEGEITEIFLLRLA